MESLYEIGYTGDGFTDQAEEDFAEQESCERAASRIATTLAKSACPSCGEPKAFRSHFTPFVGYSCAAA